MILKSAQIMQLVNFEVSTQFIQEFSQVLLLQNISWSSQVESLKDVKPSLSIEFIIPDLRWYKLS